MSFTSMNIKDFINYIITFDNVYDILESCETPYIKGFIFERLFDIIIKFGFCNLFSNKNYYHLIGNSNNGKLKKLKNFNKYLEMNIISGKSSGCSDITLLNKNTNEYIFITCKYYNEDKLIEEYDIQNIIAIINHNKEIYDKYDIYIILNHKTNFINKLKKSNDSSLYITKHIKKTKILDKEDLDKYFLNFKQDIIKNYNLDWSNIYLNNKEKLILRYWKYK